MKEELGQALRRIAQHAEKLPQEDRLKLASIMLAFNDVIESRNASRSLDNISRYFRNNYSDKKLALEASPEQLLIELGKSGPSFLRQLPSSERRKLHVHFWKALSESSDLWDKRDLENLLSYSLRKKARFEFTKETPPRAITATYHKFFSSLPPSEKEQVFEELAPRLLGEQHFRRHLRQKVYK